MDKGCWNCDWAFWIKDKVGRRMSCYPGGCECPIPDGIPDSVRTSYEGHDRLQRRGIFKGFGENCPAFKKRRKR